MAESAGKKTGNGGAHPNGKPNGHAAGRRRPAKRSPSYLLWTLSIVARLSTWAAILTILFKCPSSIDKCDENSPFICKPYFQVKNTISPHLQPYYDQYAAPYVEVARPYYNIADNKIWKPTRSYAVQYAAPWVDKAQQHAWAQWEKNGQPQLSKYQGLVQEKYDQSVAPYVTRASDAVGPYYDIARTNVLQMYYEYFMPSYEFVHPYGIQGYNAASEFTTKTALPNAYWVWNKTYAFLDAQVWPHLRVLYIQNVEPQLIRIGERLGRFKVQDKAKTAYDNTTSSVVKDSAPSSFSRPAPQSTSSSLPTSEAPAASQSVESETEVEAKSQQAPEDFSDQYLNPVQPPEVAENETEKRRKAREMVTQDLAIWQNKFAAQADDGATDLEERVDEIAKRMIAQNAKTTGRELFNQLESTIELELQELKSKISSLVEVADERPDSVQGQVIDAVRSAGMAIKKRAQAIRQWRESYDKELQNTVIAVADIHFQILDETRSLALQHIGMRWAWTDGVTYKDWAKYHELKATLNEWTEQLKQLIVTHPSLLQAQDASAQVEDEGMEIASSAAKELARLKEVARWKITARDATDNFDSDEMKLAAEAALDAQAAEIAEAAAAEASSEVPSVDQLLSDITEDLTTDAVPVDDAAPTTDAAVSDTAFDDFDSLVGETTNEAASSTPDAPILESVIENVDSSPIGLADEMESSDIIDEGFSFASSFVAEGEETATVLTDEVVETVEDLASEASEAASSIFEEATSEATEAVQPQESTSTEFIASEASEVLLADSFTIVGNESDEPAAAVDEAIETEAEDSLNDNPVDQPSQVPQSDDEPVKRVMFGAVAQKVPERQVVLDDYDDEEGDNVITKASKAAQEAYSDAVSRASDQYSSALSVVSAQIYGTPEPVHNQLFSSVSAAYQNAVAAASEKLSNAVDAAASGVQGTPATTTTPTLVDWEYAESIAAQRLNEGKLWAEIQYQSALIALGLATATPTATASMEKYYEQAKFNYYAGLGMAQDRYYSFIAGASSALSSITATPTPTTNIASSASSLASVAQESASSAISAAGSSIASVAKAADDSVSSVVDSANEKISNAGLAIADNWSNVIAEMSAQIYGEPTPTAQIAWYEHIFSDMSSYASEATGVVSDKAESASDAASDAAKAASIEAERQYQAVNDLVSELVYGKEPSFTESAFSRLQAAYATVESLASAATEAVKDKVQHEKDEL
ncbi:hypothetical protein B0T10DRAFT_472008 [Thelonectria olida]|uniref:Transcription factor hoxa13 n=1 Tax=Thelonectria olida TaxID=1576542 RepID=A0A9P8WG47_9HYPO|nr:hypothetical protein B0T10DRAFT_472008 [Thelonectria olida]